MFHAMVRHYGEDEQSMGVFKTLKAADKYCREQFLIAQGYNNPKSCGIIDGRYVILTTCSDMFTKTAYYVKKQQK